MNIESLNETEQKELEQCTGEEDFEKFFKKYTKNNIHVTCVVQLSPETTKNPMFKGCMMIVTEIKDWGVQGYVQALGQRMQPGGQAYYRATWDEFVWVGEAFWTIGDKDDN